jgi:glycosyltransferase involved in cell wall biosynthesis
LKNPVVSVIIPVFNRAATIRRAIESVLSQTLVEMEIIVVDDGSTDATCELIRNIPDKRIKLIPQKTNLGVSSARNTGMREASGQYIAWLDSDDEWFPNKLREQVSIIERHPDHIHKACYTAFEMEVQGSIQVNSPDLPNRKQLWLGCGLAAGSTLLFKRELLSDIGYLDEDFICYEDWDWLLRYCKFFGLLSIEQPQARVHFSSNRSAKKVELSTYHFLKKYQDELKGMGIYGNKVISRRWMEMSRFYAQEKDTNNTLVYLFKSLRMYPFHSPGAWILLFDSWFGTKLGYWFILQKKKFQKN